MIRALLQCRNSAPVILILLLYGSQGIAAQEIISGGGDDEAGGFAGGWVIEIGGDDSADGETAYVPAESGQPEMPRRPSQIELIIGGKGKEGMAKQGTLPVID